MVAFCFKQWLFAEERRGIDPAVISGYDRAFNAELEQAIQRCADNPPLRRSLEAMRGTRWADYIVGAILRNCSTKVDLDDALNYIVFRMLAPIGERGDRRKALFDLDPERDYSFTIGASPLLARFRTFLANDVKSVCGGKVRRVLVSTRPPGTLTITQARKVADQQPGMVGAEEIPGRPGDGEAELCDDITDILRQRSTPEMPLVDIFQAIINGMPLKDQRKRFGHTAADAMRRTIKAVLRSYGAETNNYELISLLDKAENPVRPAKRPKPPPMPKLDIPDEVRDFRSILDVIQKAGGSASMAVLASKRSRWLGRKPRDPTSTYTNRLRDVLAAMVEKDVLVKHGVRYEMGSHAQDYLEFAASSGVTVPDAASLGR